MFYLNDFFKKSRTITHDNVTFDNRIINIFLFQLLHLEQNQLDSNILLSIGQELQKKDFITRRQYLQLTTYTSKSIT